jgi:uncharacterized iron-regulated membrane protein
MTFRGFLMWVHLVLGLTSCVLVAIVAVTGAYITFQVPLANWLTPTPVLSGAPAALDAPAIVTAVEAQFEPRRVASVSLGEGNRATTVRLGDRTTVFVDPSNSTIIGSRQGRFASLENLTNLMRRLHVNLVLGPKGRVIVTLATAEVLLLALTGLWLWWRKKQWQFRALRGSIFRISWDLHSASGIWFLIPVLSMTVTGLLISMPSPIYRVAGADPAPWLNPPNSVTAGSDAGDPVSLSRVLVAADSALPGAIDRVVIPLGPAGAFGVHRTDKTVYVDQFSGSVIEVRPDRSLTAADHAYEAVEELHSGALLGVPGIAIMTLGSLMLAVMTITGVVLGWKRLLILAGKFSSRNGAD